MKKVGTILPLLLLFLTTACEPGIYNGKETGIWTEAVYSILGVRGKGIDGVKVIETDDYGRKMFYFGDSTAFNEITTHLLISQTEDKDYIYYYDNFNFLPLNGQYHTIEQADTLKEINDWNKEVNLDLCVKVKKARTKKRSLIDKEKIANTFKQLSGIEDKYGHQLYNIDSNGKHLFCMYESGNYANDFMYIMMINSDGSYEENDGLTKIEDIRNYNQILADFKVRNNWSI